MTRVIVISGFVVALAAGFMLGITLRGSRVSASDEGPRPGGRGGWLAQQLDLSPEQQEQMKQIWSEVGRRNPREDGGKRAQFRKERDESILKLVSEGDRPAYDAILKDYNDKLEAMDNEMKLAFQRAVERTKAILNPEQQKKYDELMSKQGWGPGPHDRGRPQSRPSDR